MDANGAANLPLNFGLRRQSEAAAALSNHMAGWISDPFPKSSVP